MLCHPDDFYYDERKIPPRAALVPYINCRNLIYHSQTIPRSSIYKHLSSNIPNSIIVHVNPASVHHARKAGDRCRSHPPIGDRPNFFLSLFRLLLGRAPVAAPFLSKPAPNLGFVPRKVAARNTSSALLHDPTVMPDLQTIRSTGDVVRADCSCRRARGRRHGRVVIYSRSRARPPICILSGGACFLAALMCFFLLPRKWRRYLWCCGARGI